MFSALERAVELEPNKETYSLLIKAYRDHEMNAEADIMESKLKKLIIPSGRPRRVLRPKRVVI